MTSMAGFPQHASTDQRNFSDEFKVPTHYDFLGQIEEEIKELATVYPFIPVSDQEVIDKRKESGYSLSQGDALEAVLREKCKSYEGMVFWRAIQNLGLEIEGEDDNPMPSPRRLLAIERQIEENNEQVDFKVKTALYSAQSATMFYFYDS